MKDVRSIDSNKLRIQAELLVSIVIPCYNYGSFISQTLDCLLTQSYQNWEAIIIDDGSTDNTRQVVDGYLRKDPRFIYIYQLNQGLSASRNTGLNNANGSYVQFLDADDLLSRGKIAAQVRFMEQYLDCDISYTRAYYFEDQKPNELFTNRNLTKKKKDVGIYLLKVNPANKCINSCPTSDKNIKKAKNIFRRFKNLYID